MRMPRARPYTTGEAYPVEELLDDLLRVGGGQNRLLAQLVVERVVQCRGVDVGARRALASSR